MADSSVAQTNGCQRNTVLGQEAEAQPARKKLRRTTEEPAGDVPPASGLETAQQKIKQSAMQLLQAANVPQAGLQEFEAQWTARPDARQAAAPKAPTSWTYYSPRGEKVKGVAGLIQVFTSRLLATAVKEDFTVGELGALWKRAKAACNWHAGVAQDRKGVGEGACLAGTAAPGGGRARCVKGPPTPNQAAPAAALRPGAAGAVPELVVGLMATVALLQCLHQRYPREEALAFALVVQIMLASDFARLRAAKAAREQAAAPQEAAALEEATHSEAVVQDQAASSNLAAPAPAALPTQPEPSCQPAKALLPTSGAPGPSKQAEERPAKKRAAAAVEASAAPLAGREAARTGEGAASRGREEFDVARHLQKGMAVLLRTEEDAEDESGWHKPWSIARVNMVHRERPMSIDVTWLKPSLGERWWEAKWTAWKLQVPGKGGRKGYNRPWTTNGVEADTVQWGTVLNPDHTFRLLDQRVLRMEVHRLETGKE